MTDDDEFLLKKGFVRPLFPFFRKVLLSIINVFFLALFGVSVHCCSRTFDVKNVRVPPLVIC